MPATRVKEGTKIDYTPGSAVAAGTVVLQGDLFGVAEVDIPANTLGSLAVEGIFDITKATTGGSGFAVGVDVFWDAGNSRASNSSASGANKQIGKATQAAADADTTVRVLLTAGSA